MVFVGHFLSVWGHEITDNLKHFWFYFDERFSFLKNLKFVYLLDYAHLPPSANFLTLLKTIGIPPEKLEIIQTPTQFKKVYIPDECFICDLHLNLRRYTKEYLNLLKRLPKLSPPMFNIQKVYFSRTQYHSPKDFNEITIEKRFKKEGFTIIYPEKIDFLIELSILQNCEIFASTTGSVAHNIIFCRCAKVALFLRKYRDLNSYQSASNAIGSCFTKDLNIIYIDSALFFNFPKLRYFLYETPALRRFFNLPKKLFPFFKYLLFLLWVFDSKFLYKWTLPIRIKLKLRTRLRKILKIQGKR